MNEEFKLKLELDISIMVNVIKKNISHDIVSIILYGSYGRGEGAFYLKNNIINVYNDYDLLIVVRDQITDVELLKVKQILLKKVGVRWIDISQTTSSKLKKLKPTIFNYDLKYGSKIIWGDTYILDLIPRFTPDQLSLEDAKILYFTRLYTFLGSFEHNAFVEGVKGEESRFFRNQMAKAVLAIIDVLLLQKKVYDSSYIERVRRIDQLFSKNEELLILSKWALKEKLSPEDKTMTGQETFDLFIRILKLYFQEMHLALSKYYNRKVSSTDDLKDALKNSPKEIIFQIKVLILTRTLKSYYRTININLLQSYTTELFLKESSERENILNKCTKIIEKIDSNLCKVDLNFNSLKQIVVKLSR